MSAFKPGRAWQDVPDDAVLPPGLEIQMDMSTGRKRARIPPRTARKAETTREAFIRAFAEQARAAQPAAPDIAAGRLDWTTLVDRLPPAREWIWPDQIPHKTVTLVHGPGGVGKSTLLQQVATAVAARTALFGGEPLEQRTVLAWFGEDDHDEIWRRQAAINRALGLADLPAALQRAFKPNGPEQPADPDGLLTLVGKAHFFALPGEDITLFLGKNEGDYQDGPALPTLREQVGDLKPGLVLLDSAAKIYGGPENNRQLVTRCLQRLIGLCVEFDCAIILNGHDAKTGEYSGSTAWENTVRARLHFKREPETDDDGNPVKGGDHHNTLTRPKANYAEISETGIAMRWHAGAFAGIDPAHMSPEMAAAREQADADADQAFLDALRQLTDRQLSASDSSSSTYYAPKQIARHGLADGRTKRQLEQSMRRLFMAGTIARGDLPWKTLRRTPAQGLVICT